MKTIARILLFTALWVCFGFVTVSNSGCAGLMLKNLREKIPVGYADTINGHVSVAVGGGAGFDGKNVVSMGKGKITADEWSEHVDTPWGATGFSMTNAGIGVKKPKVMIKPDGTAVPEEPSAITVSPAKP